jgi:hypothetical protein
MATVSDQLRDYMAPTSVFARGNGLLDLHPTLGDHLDKAVKCMAKALSWQEVLKEVFDLADRKIIEGYIVHRLALADAATQQLAGELQGLMGTKVSKSACLGLARSMVEQAFPEV